VTNTRLRCAEAAAVFGLPRTTRSIRLPGVALVALALTLAACTSSQTVPPTTPTVPPTTQPLPAVDLSATPTGWVPVAYGDAQVSVPSSFSVFYLYPSQSPCGFAVSQGALAGTSDPPLIPRPPWSVPSQLPNAGQPC